MFSLEYWILEYFNTIDCLRNPYVSRENGLLSYELVVPDFFTHELLNHAKNHINNFILLITYLNYRF